MKNNIFKTIATLLLGTTMLLSANAFAGNSPASGSSATAAISASASSQANILVQNLGYHISSISLLNDGSGNYLVTLSNGGHVIYYPSIGIVAVQDLPQ